MSKPFWTPEKKQDYIKLLDRRDQDRAYHRQYMNEVRHSGKYKYFRDDNNKVVYKKKLDETDEKRSRK